MCGMLMIRSSAVLFGSSEVVIAEVAGIAFVPVPNRQLSNSMPT